MRYLNTSTFVSLQSLATDPLWVAYSGAPKGGGKINKAPLNPKTGRAAKNDNPATWSTREAAERHAKALRAPGNRPGVGVQLGDLGDGTALCGVDLDGCYSAALEPWAVAVCERFQTYAEISPSGEGVKVFFRVRIEDLPVIRKAMGTEHRKMWKLGDHYGPELHVTNSYFAVTGRAYGGNGDALRVVPLEDVLWLIQAAGPAFLGGVGGKAKGRDMSGSGLAFSFLLDLFRMGSTEEEARAHIELDGGAAGEWWSRTDDRQRDRAVARTRAEIERERESYIAAFDQCWTAEELEAIQLEGLVGDPAEVGRNHAVPLGRYGLDQDGVIRAFTDRHAGELLYDHHAGRWSRFNGDYWKREETKLALHYARQVSTELAKRDARAKPLKTVATWEAVERGARTVRAFSCTSDKWDQDPMLLGTPDGTVDLKSGHLRKARPQDHISKITAVAPINLDSFDPARDCSQWLAFLDFALGGDKAAIRFLQQWGGYTLTGSIKEEVLLFIYGPGGSGKSTAVNTIMSILNDYAVAVATSTLTAKKYDAHKEELARLHGPRMAIASETEKGSKWAENRIKEMTGGDMITANFMRQNSFSFRPQFKLTIVGNNAPSLSDVDSAIRRRFMILPFNRPPTRRDDNLAERLKAEWPGILSWLVQGCLDWQANGLVRPAVVNAATESYFADQDTFGQWLAERCTTGLGKAETTEALFQSWQQYAWRIGEEPGSKNKVFPERMQQRGFKPASKVGPKRTRGFSGIALADAEDDCADLV